MRIPIDSFQLARKQVAFGGGVGVQGAQTLFNVTGDVIFMLLAKCTEDLAGVLATIEVGVANNTAVIIEQTTATNIDNNKVWRDNSPSLGVETIPEHMLKFACNGQDIIQTIATADITDGEITYYLFWQPVSGDGSVVAA